MKKYSIKKSFFIFSSFIIFYLIFYLYLKHDVGNDTSISEWLINYQGGFTRRGLGGEINIFIAKILSISLRDAILLVQIVFHSIYVILLFIYINEIKLDIFQIFALFAPIFLLYPIAELEALGRKEIFIFLFFTLIIFFSSMNYSPKIINSLIFLFFPIICLIWEEVILFAPFFAVVLIVKNQLLFFSQVFYKLLKIFSSSIIVMIIIFAFPLSNEGHVMMCEYLQMEFGERCYMSADLLIKNTIYFDTFGVHEKTKFFPHYFRYLMIFSIGFLPLYFCIYKNNFVNSENFITKHFKPVNLYFILYLPIALPFAFGHDWGRWIHILYSLSILLYFYLIKNNVLTTDFDNNFLAKFLLKRKKTLIFLFFIFAFCWNPKTLISGDIATNSLYKIVYNSSKIIINHNGARIFQDSPLIKFHRKYFE